MLRSIIKLNSLNSSALDGRIAAVRPWSAQPVKSSDDTGYSKAIPYNKIPGPSTIQTLIQFSPFGSSYKTSIDVTHRILRNKYGNLVRVKGFFRRKDMVLSFNPDDYEKIFRGESQRPYRPALETLDYYRKEYRPEAFQETCGLTVDQGDDWQKFRSIVNPVLMQPETVHYYIDKTDDIAREFIDVVKSTLDHNNETPADFDQWLNRWALETTGVLALDQRLGVLKRSPSDEAQRILENMRLFFELTYQLEIEPSLWKYYSTPKLNKLMNAFDDITDFVKEKVDEAIIKLEKNPSPDANFKGVLERLLSVDRIVARVMAFDMLMAGIDTTTSAAAGVLYCLARHPEKQEKLRQELRTLIPEKNSPITPDTMQDMPYLRACIKEGARLYPAVFGIARKLSRNMIFQGYQVPKDTIVVMAPMILQRSEQYYPRPTEFLPERWLRGPECDVPRHTHPFIYFPFGFGSRSCVGKRLASMEMEILISRLTRQYEYRWNYGDLKLAASIVNIPLTPLKFQLREIPD